MAESIATRLSLDEVRASVKRMQVEGERLVGRIREDAGALVRRRPSETIADVRRRAAEAVRELEARRNQIRSTVLTQLTTIANDLFTRVGVAKSDKVDELSRRVAELERRIDELSKDKAA
jgi:hypothetical protein